MTKSREQKHVFDALFVIILFFVFLLCALSVIMIGSAVYQNSTETMNDHFTTKTALSYLVEKVRQNDVAGNIDILERDGTTILRLNREFDGIGYHTYIYVYEGQLMELFIKEGTDAPLNSGKKIMDLAAMEVEQPVPNLYRITITDSNGNSNSVSVAERSSL